MIDSRTRLLFVSAILVFSLIFSTFLGAAIVRADNNGFSISFEVPDPQITKLDGKDDINVEGFVSVSIPGQPVLPQKVYKLLLPSDVDEVVKTHENLSEAIENINKLELVKSQFSGE